MNVGPSEAREYLRSFFSAGELPRGRAVWFFPPAVSLESVAKDAAGHDSVMVGVQDIHWEPKGAFTGATSGPLAAQAGARLALVGHSERRHVFGETNEQTGKKIAAALAADLSPVLCVGETLAQREAGETMTVITRQLEEAFAAHRDTGRVTIAYEPVWAIGTGRNATPEDASAMHRVIRTELHSLCGDRALTTAVLYGGSVNPTNATALLAAPGVDGLLVGGASLDAGTWLSIVHR
jgi:triosephosphate isomerase